MGFLSNWFGSSTGSTAGSLATAPEAQQRGNNGPAAASKKPNVWRSTFDPGSNPNIDRVGSGMYDTVHRPSDKATGSTWEQILRAEDFKRRSFSDIDRNKDGFVDAQELKAALPPSLAASADTHALIQQANPATQGKLSRKDFNAVLDRYFMA